MSPLFWYVAAAAGGALLCAVVGALLRAQSWKHQVLHAVAHRLRGGVVDHVRGHGFRARGQLGQLEVTVEMHRDSRRPTESPMWRVLAVGPVRIDQPVEVAAGGWTTDIDPWLERLAPIAVPSGEGPVLAVRAQQPVPFDHPVLEAMREQGAAITNGALYVRPDLMRAEVHVERHGEAGGLFAYLAAMSDVSERRRARETGPRSPRTGHLHVVNR
jgi:hypothetical protein